MSEVEQACLDQIYEWLAQQIDACITDPEYSFTLKECYNASVGKPPLTAPIIAPTISYEAFRTMLYQSTLNQRLREEWGYQVVVADEDEQDQSGKRRGKVDHNRYRLRKITPAEDSAHR